MKVKLIDLFVKTEKTLLIVLLIVFSLFPVIPNTIKGLPVVVLVLITLIFVLFKKSNKNRQYTKYAILFSSLFLMYLISLLYTSNIEYGIKKIETTSSLLLIPFCIALIYNRIEYTNKIKSIFVYGYILFSTIYAISIILYFNYLGFDYCRGNLSHCLSYLDGMFVLSEHPIYASMFIALGTIFIVNSFGKQNLFFKISLLLSLILNVFVLFFLIRKGVVLALSISFIGFFLFERRYKKINYLKAVILLSVLFVLSLSFKNSIIKRFSELSALNTYEIIDPNNSTSIRYSIYNCSFNMVSQNPLFGYGIGDVKDELVKCYETKSQFLVSERYNSHNQFVGILLSTGFLGLIVFIIQLVFYFKNAFLNNDALFFQCLIFFVFLFLTENILDRQSGVILFSFLANYFFLANYSNNNLTVN